MQRAMWIVIVAGTAAAAQPARPAPEIADMVKSLGGTWRCDGTAGTEKVKATLTGKVDIAGVWAHETLIAGKLELHAFTTFDERDKKWHRIELGSDGEAFSGTADTMKDMKMDVLLDSRAAQRREHVDASDLRRGLHVTAEQSLDKGKTWQPVYDLLCRR